jgi:hypothetical protein
MNIFIIHISTQLGLLGKDSWQAVLRDDEGKQALDLVQLSPETRAGVFS